MEKRILIIYTGGTIGMKPSDPAGGSLAPVPGYLSELMREMPELRGPSEAERWRFELIEYDPLLDSSDMTPAAWAQIATDIEFHYDEFDGFVVLHGTDTLAYTSSALSFFVEGVRKPIVVTGSQLPFGVPRSDARNNIVTAFQVAATMPTELAQVCVVFGSRILQGNRVTKVSALAYEAFDSPRGPYLGRAGIELTFNLDLELESRKDPVRFQTDPPPNESIAVIRLFPGFSHEIIRSLCVESRNQLKGLVLEAYGTGNGPSSDREFLLAISEAKRRGVVIVVVAQPLDGAVDFGNYAAGNALRIAGAISGEDMTTEAALTKLYYLISLGLNPEQIEAAMKRPIAGEMTSLS